MKPIGVYIHVPFCVRKCAYCDFVSYPVAELDVQAYFEALIERELADACRWLKAADKLVETVYMGGGTPTSVPAKCLTELLRSCLERLPVADHTEVTVEMNPGTVSPGYIAELLAAGANRLSIGVQSLNERTLKVLGRIHSPDEAQHCVEAVREAGCRNVNLDLIYGTPGETLDELMRSLKTIISLDPEHVSVYGLSIPEGTRLADEVRAGSLKPASDERQREMYIAIREALAAAGYVQYEISNWAKPGFECRHNLNYWRGGEYLGLGCAASSFVDGVRRKNTDDHLEYVRLLHSARCAVSEQETLTRGQRIDEAIMLGLRMREGIRLDSLIEREGYDLLGDRRDQVQRLSDARLIEVKGDRLRLTDQGVLVTDEVIVWLV